MQWVGIVLMYVGIGVLVLSTVTALVRAAYYRQWGWFLLIVFAFPTALIYLWKFPLGRPPA